jgi:hypothetical protein
MHYPKIKAVTPIENYSLFITFDNGITKSYNMKNWFSHETFKPLEDKTLFDLVKIDKGGCGIRWNDEIDLSECELWENGVDLTN